uniref:Uncharacterized protein n=1 Tax=Myoviridae sp. ctshb19 TaxID=2825194 RepID=A0A8S5UGU3_9CAUD|nr:MAG TPA: hypothetical protein [Myoviridae sp. ctshb19]
MQNASTPLQPPIEFPLFHQMDLVDVQRDISNVRPFKPFVNFRYVGFGNGNAVIVRRRVFRHRKVRPEFVGIAHRHRLTKLNWFRVFTGQTRRQEIIVVDFHCTAVVACIKQVLNIQMHLHDNVPVFLRVRQVRREESRPIFRELFKLLFGAVVQQLRHRGTS